jgi:hypothetical protein
MCPLNLAVRAQICDLRVRLCRTPALHLPSGEAGGGSTASERSSPPCLQRHGDSVDWSSAQRLPYGESQSKHNIHLVTRQSNQPNLAQPNLAEPNLAQSNLAEPNLAQSNLAQSNLAEPNLAQPDIRSSALPRFLIPTPESNLTRSIRCRL